MTEDSMHRTLDAALARNSGPSAEDVEVLAEARCPACGHDALAHNAYPWRQGRCRFTGYMCNCNLGLSDALTPWLADHTAAAKREGARAVVEAVEAEIRDGRLLAYPVRIDRIGARARAAARFEGGA